MSASNNQIAEIRKYVQDLPSKIKALFDTPEKQRGFYQYKDKIIAVFDEPEKHQKEYSLMRYAEEYYNLGPIGYPVREKAPETAEEELFAAYYIIGTLDEILNSPEKTKKLFEIEFSYDYDGDEGNDALSRIGFIDAEYPHTIINRLNTAIETIREDLSMKTTNTEGVLKSLPDRIREYAQLFQELPRNLENATEEYKPILAGSHIRKLLRIGVFKEDRFQLENAFYQGQSESGENGYRLLWEEVVKNLRSRIGLPYDSSYDSFAKDCQLVADELNKEVQEPTCNENTSKAAKKKRPKAAEMENRNRIVAMAVAEVQIKYNRLATVPEIMDKTKLTANQIYATASYRDGKIAKKSAKLTPEMTGSSVTESEYFGEKSIQHSRAKRRSKSDQAELEALIDQQEKDESRNVIT